MKPLNNNVLIRPKLTEMQTPSGLLLPESSVKESGYGQVLAVGSGKVVMGKKIPVDLEPGDWVYYNIRKAVDVDFGGPAIMITDDDIYAKETK